MPVIANGHGTASRDLTLTRVIAAPRDSVFAAWVQASQLAQWWGPRGFTNPVCDLDARPGGELRIVMRAPDGTEYPMRGTFREIAAPARLVFSNAALGGNDTVLIDGLTTVTFADQGSRTALIVETGAVARTDAAAAMIAGMEEGWSQTLDRLAEYVEGGGPR
jgi:uncharacterized protein YndB with AHSA1/START domain